MNPPTVDEWNLLITCVELSITVFAALLWIIPNGHCPKDCACRKSNRIHK